MASGIRLGHVTVAVNVMWVWWRLAGWRVVLARVVLCALLRVVCLVLMGKEGYCGVCTVEWYYLGHSTEDGALECVVCIS